MRTKRHGLALLIIAACLLAFKFWWAGSLFIALALLNLYKWKKHPYRFFDKKINEDANEIQFPISQYPILKHKLLQLYSKLEWSKIKYPVLAETYSQLIKSFWINIRNTQSTDKWNSITEQYIDYWPIPNKELRPSPVKAICNAQSDVRRWEISIKAAEAI